MDAPEYVGRRAERALGLLPVALVVAACAAALGGLVGLWRLTTPSTGLGGTDAGGSLWQRVTMAVASGYDVAPLAWGALALVLLAALVRAPRSGLPVPGPRVQRTAVVLAAVLVGLSVVAVVLVVGWAVLTRGEVSFSVEVPGDQDGGRVTTQVGSYVTDPWVGLLHVVPALVAVVLAGGTLATLLGPVPATARVEQPATLEADPAAEALPTRARTAGATAAAPDDGDDDGDDHGDGDVRDGSPDGATVVPATDPSVFARDGAPTGRPARESGGAARFARSVASTSAGHDGHVPRPEPTSADPLAGWTIGPGTTSDVAFRRPGSGAEPAPSTPDGGRRADAEAEHDDDAVDGSGGTSDASGESAGDRAGPQVAVPARDPYRRPGV